MLEIIKAIKSRLSYRYNLQEKDIENAIDYLDRYRYVDKRTTTLQEILRAVEEFQRRAGLEADAELGPKTLTAMTWHRCGVPDFQTEAISNRKWGIKKLKYYVHEWNDMERDEWFKEIRASFDAWSEVADITFEQVASRNDAQLLLATGSGRSDNFDGPSGTLAWAQLPSSTNYRGVLIIKFDEGETWIRFGQNARGIFLRNVATHEIGHALGLEHSSVNSSLMAPFYSPNVVKPQRHDDVSRIQALYGPPTNSNPVPDPEPDPTPSPDKLVIEVTGQIETLKIPGYRIVKVT